jgi:hypothetical protein
VFDRHAVATHTSEATENYDTNGFGHRLTVLSLTDHQRVYKTALAHALTNALTNALTYNWPIHINT